MPSGMFSIDSILSGPVLSGRPNCKEPLLLHRTGPLVLPGLADSIYADYSGLSPPGVHSVGGTRFGYTGCYYGQLQVQGSGAGPPCCGAVPGLSPQQCPCFPAGKRTRTSGLSWSTLLNLKMLNLDFLQM